ncbi:MAG TPA: hypothetical protein VNH42_01020, partial [Mariprofundaceae bacterium]|nr:hypothetical protein [Mariprofundaceae bacterium]
PSVKQTGQSELDRMFRGKTPAQVAQIKQNLLNQAKLRFGGDPKLMAAIEQNLNDYVRVHVTPSTLVARPHQGGGQQGPGTRMLNPQPLPPRSGNFQRQKLPAAQR